MKTVSKPPKIKSYFFRRLVTLTFVTTLLFALLTGSVFYFVSRNIMISETVKQLQVAAKSISSLLSLSRNINLSLEDTTQFINNAGVPRARAHIFNSEGRMPFYPLDEKPLQNIIDHYSSTLSLMDLALLGYLPSELQDILNHRRELRNLLPYVLQGNEVSRVFENFVVVGVPVQDANNPDMVTDAVFISREFRDVFDLRNTLYVSLIASMSMVAFIMFIAVIIVSRQVSRPVYNMRNIALSMAHGNFKAVADESMDGEMGELASSLNLLSSELSKTIRALQIERNRLLSILDGLSEGILAIDSDGQITHINPALEQLFGPLEGQQTPQQYIQDMDLWQDMECVMALGGHSVRSLHKDHIILRVSISPLETDTGEVAGAVALFRDVTESERLEQTRRDYVANVSHELRTPVSSLQSLAETLQDGLITSQEDQQRYYGYMLRESQRLSRLIDDLLELSRLQSGSVALQRSRVNMPELLMDVEERFSLLAKNHNKHFAVAGLQECPDAYSNGDRVDEILVVLLDNAFKYTEEGSDVKLSASWDDDKIYLSVQDSGIGIAKEDIPHLFERFYKVDKAHSGNGTGLGLSIAYEVIQLLGESICVESEQGQGSTFQFTLTRYDAQQRQPTYP